jgi:hypothetical protein
LAKSYILKGTENEYLLVIRAEDEKAIHKIIDHLYSSRSVEIKEVATELEKSLNEDVDRGDTSKARSKNKSKSTNSNNSGRRKTKDT